MKLTVNGVSREVKVAPLKRLLDLLREDLELTGTKEGCGEGECGACSVLIDGELVNSCLVAACQVEGAQVLTIEGVAANGQLTALQRIFVERGGSQCGICTPGMIVAAHRFLRSGQQATNEKVREAIAGNLCRCTGYAKIVEAIQLAALEEPASPDPESQR
ncbi:MAG TPA: (2Fe-2S)-binding protein [Myxococcales bacterium]|nr:(2Fe-2S)-binding protein [Myxococcales bacterium]